MPGDPLRVFLSGSTADFGSVRLRLRSGLARGGCHVIHQADFPQTQTDTVLKLAHLIEPCGILIHLIGQNPGSIATPKSVAEYLAYANKNAAFLSNHPKLRAALGDFSGITYTQWEVLIALHLGLEVFVYGDATHPDPAHPQRSHLDCLLLAETPRHANDFADEVELYLKVMADLMAYYRPRLPAAQMANFTRPTNLPYATLGKLFKGRDEFLKNLRTELSSQGAAVIRGIQAIHGMGGVGKTRTAIEYGWLHAEEYNALLFVSADSPEALQRNLANLCGPLVLNLPEHSATEESIQYTATLRWLHEHPGWFLIIDNVDTKEAAASVEALLVNLSAGHVVITSRIADWSGQVTSLDLDVLDEESAASFLLERTKDRRIVTSQDNEDSHELARTVDCLALALEQAAAYIRQQRLSIGDYLKRWQEVPTETLAWHDEVKMKYPRSLAVTYETSVAELSEGARALFYILSWLAPDPVPLSALASLTNGARSHLIELENLHLVRFREDGQSFTVHRLVQEITRQKQGNPLPPRALVTALSWINGLFPVDLDDVRRWPLLEPLIPHAQSVLSFADSHAISKPTSRLMGCVAIFFNAKAQHSAAEPLMRRALVIDKASLGEDHPDVATQLNNLAQLLKATNHLSEAEPLMRRALIIDETSLGKDHPKIATRLNNLALLLEATNRLSEAEPLLRRALAIGESSLGKDHPDVATQLNNLGQLLRATNRLSEAEPLLRHALTIVESSFSKDHPRVALQLNNLALLLQDTNRLPEAESLLRRALAIDESSLGKDHPDVATGLNNLAQLLKATHRFAEAEPLMRRALAIDESSFGKDHPKIAIQLNNLARLLHDTNRLSEAEPFMRRHVVIFLQFSWQTGHRHPHLMDSLRNYAGLIQEWKGDEAVFPALFPLGAEAGMPKEKYLEILKQAFGG